MVLVERIILLQLYLTNTVGIVPNFIIEIFGICAAGNARYFVGIIAHTTAELFCVDVADYTFW